MYNGVRAVLTGREPEQFELHQFVEHVIAIGIEQTKDTATTGAVTRTDDHVKTVEGIAGLRAWPIFGSLASSSVMGLSRSGDISPSLGP